MTDDGLPDWVPRHPRTPGVPAPLVARYLVVDEDLWTAGPWKTLHVAARTAGWTVRGVVARGWGHDSRGHLGALTDSLSLRLWRPRVEDGETPRTDRAVALWGRTTWPILGRTRKKAGDADEVAGEGRKTNEGKTWLWHPPMAPPDVEVDDRGKTKDPLAAAWKFTAGWIWTAGTPIRPASSADVRDWVKEMR